MSITTPIPKEKTTTVEKAYFPESDEIYILPIPPERDEFIQKVQTAFVNKMVSLTFSNDELIFDFAIFEKVQGRNLKITASSSQYYIKTLTNNQAPEGFRRFLAKTRPIDLDHERNLSAQIMRQSILEMKQGRKPLVEYIDMRNDPRLHPKLRKLVTKTMRYAMGTPLFMRGQPIGMLWGIRRKALSLAQKKEVEQQLHSLREGIEIILVEEMDSERDAYFARRKIDKIDTLSTLETLLYTRYPGQTIPVKSQFRYSYRYQAHFRQDTSFIVPTSQGFSISLKRFLPEKLNGRNLTILMIPGFFCNRSLMDRIAREMALRFGYRVFTLDMRGRSKFTLPKTGITRLLWSVDDYIWDDFPKALRWLRENYPEDRVVVLGHSMGGMIPQFYASAREFCQELCQREDLPDPDGLIAGIVAITSPSYINLKFSNQWLEILFRYLRDLGQNRVLNPAFRLFSLGLESAVGTIDLNSFFNFLHKMSQTIRNLSFDIGKLPTIKDFIGYPQITPPEWYFFMEDVFCEESIRVIIQFLSSMTEEGAFRSLDGRINYTLAQEKLKIPLLSVIGTLDTLAPPHTVLHTQNLARSPKNKILEFEQGHLGIITHPPTVRAIAEATHDWLSDV